MALRDIKVLDFTRVLAGPFCTMLLGDAGAVIVKIERPPRLCGTGCKTKDERIWAARYEGTLSGGGDDSRRFGPPFLPRTRKDNGGALEDQLISTYYLSINRNKKSVAVDLSRDEGQDIARRLATDWADVVVENFKPGTMEKMGLSYETDLKSKNPGLVYCSITGYGATGPWSNLPGYDIVVSGTHGLMSITGNGEEPAKVGVAMTDIVTGALAHGAILTALHNRKTSKNSLGQRVDLSLMESQLACLSTVASGALNMPPGTPAPKRMGTAHASIAPYQAFRCKDGGHIVVGTGNDKQFRALCRAIGVEAVADNPLFKDNASRVKERSKLIKILEEAFHAKTRDEWNKLLCGQGFPFGPVRDVVESFQCEQAKHRKMTLNLEHPVAGKVLVPSHPAKFSASPIANGIDAPLLPPPMLGEHTHEVLTGLLRMHDNEIDGLEADGIIRCWESDDYDETETVRAQA